MIFRRFASTTLPKTIHQLLTIPPTSPLNATHVSVSGWVKSVRRQKRVTFAVLSDGSNSAGLQAVFTNTEAAQRLTNGMAVRITGQLADSPGLGQDKELKVEQVEVLGECDPEEYPIQKQALSAEYLRQNVHLRGRTDAIASMLRLRDSLQRSLHQYFHREGFLYTHAPILTSNDCEGAGETFQISPSIPDSSEAVAHPTEQNSTASTQAPDPPSHFFGQPAYLTVSSQLHLEAFATSLSRVYTLSPCFRAERSQTNRHLSEFWMLEAEWAFVDRVKDLCIFLESMLKSTWQQTQADEALWKHHTAERHAVLGPIFGSSPWPQLTYTEAISELQKHASVSKEAFVFDPQWGKPLQSEHERWLAEVLIGGPLFVTDYPTELKPFYMRSNPDAKTVGCFDLLVPGVGELAGGSLREERLDVLSENISRHNLSKEEYAWYLDLRKYGGAPHGGFGLGFERAYAPMILLGPIATNMVLTTPEKIKEALRPLATTILTSCDVVVVPFTVGSFNPAPWPIPRLSAPTLEAQS